MLNLLPQILKIFSILIFSYSKQVFSEQGNNPQTCVLYSEQRATGESITLNGTNEPDLAKLNFDNKAKSMCVTGIWIFYDHPNYNTEKSGTVEYIHGKKSFCGNMQNLPGKVTSVRFAGFPKDGDANTITFYDKEYFQGHVEYAINDLGDLKLDQKVESLILTGAASWTVYTEPNYGGESFCLVNPRSDKSYPAFVGDLSILGIKAHGIRSVRLGCHGANNVTAG